MKNRIRQRCNRKRKEELLNIRDICGIRDPTPYEAVKNMIRKKEGDEAYDNEKRKVRS